MRDKKSAPAGQGQVRNVIGYRIVGPKCGIDRSGVFNCYCGKCERLDASTEKKYFAAIANADKSTAKPLLDLIELNRQDRETLLRIEKMAKAMLVILAVSVVLIVGMIAKRSLGL